VISRRLSDEGLAKSEAFTESEAGPFRPENIFIFLGINHVISSLKKRESFRRLFRPLRRGHQRF
jgi:hypothetical protein